MLYVTDLLFAAETLEYVLAKLKRTTSELNIV